MTETKRIVIERIDAATGNTKKSMNLMLELVRTMVGQLAEATGMPEKFVSRAADAVLQALKEIEPHLRTAIALEYAAHYSEEELEEMVRFYESTTGRRMQEMQPSFHAYPVNM